MSQLAPNAALAAPPELCFCPTCMARMKVPASLPKGARLKCPKCKNAFDPGSASSRGDDRTKLQANIAADGPGMPEWVWAILVGAGVGLFVGLIGGFLSGLIDGTFSDYQGGSFWAGMTMGLIKGVVFFVVVGGLIGVTIPLTGSSWAGYIVAFFAFFPCLMLLHAMVGPLMMIAFAVLVVQMIDHKLYS